jgi:formamidopyrimidine-DNA glycosylase
MAGMRWLELAAARMLMPSGSARRGARRPPDNEDRRQPLRWWRAPVGRRICLVPELPDVEGYRTALAKHLPGTRVRGVQVLDIGVLRNATAARFRDQLVGCRFQTPRRHGKWLLLPTNAPTVLIHHGMTGGTYFIRTGAEGKPDVSRSDRLIINTDDGDLHYADLRKLRGVWIVGSEAEITAVAGAQGPDALDISATAFRAALRGRRGALKTTLMNQEIIAGLGNMLSDEICWRARIHPARTVTTLDAEQLGQIHRVMRTALRAAVKHGRIPRTRGWLSSTRDRDPAPCPRCQTALRRSQIGGRTSIWCPRCQPTHTPLGIA